MSSDDTVTIRLSEEYDVANAPTITGDVDAAIADGARRVVIDMSSVVFMDSTALGALIEAKKRAEAGGATLELADVPANTERLLRLTALDQVFTITSTSGDEDD